MFLCTLEHIIQIIKQKTATTTWNKNKYYILVLFKIVDLYDIFYDKQIDTENFYTIFFIKAHFTC